METMISQHIVKRAKGCKRRVGVMVGRLEGNDINIGWSRTNFNAGDNFDPIHGLNLAIERSKAAAFVPAPHSFRNELYGFQERCARYFKGDKAIMKIVIQHPPKIIKGFCLKS